MPELPGAQGNKPNPNPFDPHNRQDITTPEFWVPQVEVAMAFTNYLWAAGMTTQATAYWTAYCKAAGMTP